MNISLFGYRVEVYISKSKYGRKFASKLLVQSHSYVSNQLGYNTGYKIALIKALRIDQDINLADAKEAIESMFDFDNEGKPIIK